MNRKPSKCRCIHLFSDQCQPTNKAKINIQFAKISPSTIQYIYMYHVTLDTCTCIYGIHDGIYITM